MSPMFHQLRYTSVATLAATKRPVSRMHSGGRMRLYSGHACLGSPGLSSAYHHHLKFFKSLTSPFLSPALAEPLVVELERCPTD